MRVLLDEHLPVGLADAIQGHSVSTVRDEGWAGLTNGELLARAADSGFEVLLTNDSSIEYQQNLKVLSIGVLILDAPSNKLEDLVPLIASASEVLSSVLPGKVVHRAG
ncbi:MAG: DUF5615 family PIN-like protein [Actinomycetota bacterium]